MAERLAGLMAYRIRGVLYPSQSAAARALGLNPRTIRRALEDGRENIVGLEYSGPRAILFDGVRYSSIAAAAQSTGIKAGSLYAALSLGQKTCHGKQISYDTR